MDVSCITERDIIDYDNMVTFFSLGNIVKTLWLSNFKRGASNKDVMNISYIHTKKK